MHLLIGPYNQAIKAGNTLTYLDKYLDSLNYGALKGTIQEETELVMESLKSILKEARMTFENVVKTNFIDDMNNFQHVMKFMESTLKMKRTRKRNCCS